MDWWNVGIAGRVLESGKADAPQYAWLAAIKAAERWHNPDCCRERALGQTDYLDTGHLTEEQRSTQVLGVGYSGVFDQAASSGCRAAVARDIRNRTDALNQRRGVSGST
jgi:hypothetical protein